MAKNHHTDNTILKSGKRNLKSDENAPCNGKWPAVTNPTQYRIPERVMPAMNLPLDT